MTVKQLEQIVRDLALGIGDPLQLEAFEPKDVWEAKANLKWRGSTVLHDVRAMNEAERTVEYVATCEIVDRMGDLVITKPRTNLGQPRQDGTVDFGAGFETSNFFLAGAPFLWSHLSREPAVGQVVASKQARIDGGDGKKVWATIQTVRYLFDERVPMAVPCWILVEARIACAVSVGFVPRLTLYQVEDKIRASLGLGRYGVVFLTSDQLELSQAQTPACPLAVRPKDIEESARKLLDKAVEEHRVVGGVEVTPALVSDFFRTMPITAEAEAERLRSSLDGFFGSLGAGPEKETPAAEPQQPTPSIARPTLAEDRGARLPEPTETVAQEPEPPKAESRAALPIDGTAIRHVGGETWSLIVRGNEAQVRSIEEFAEQVLRGGAPPPAQPLQLNAYDASIVQRAFDAVCSAAENLGEFQTRIKTPAKGLDNDGENISDEVAELLRANLEVSRQVLAAVGVKQRQRGGDPAGGDSGAERAVEEIADYFRR